MSGSTGSGGSPQAGIAAVCIAMALFAGNDAILKLLSERIPAAQVMLLRGLLGGVLLLGLVFVSGAASRLRSAFRSAVLLRTFVPTPEGIHTISVAWMMAKSTDALRVHRARSLRPFRRRVLPHRRPLCGIMARP